MLSINAVHAFKYGFEDQDVASSRGSQVNDVILDSTGKTKTNNSGGIHAVTEEDIIKNRLSSKLHNKKQKNYMRLVIVTKEFSPASVARACTASARESRG